MIAKLLRHLKIKPEDTNMVNTLTKRYDRFIAQLRHNDSNWGDMFIESLAGYLTEGKIRIFNLCWGSKPILSAEDKTGHIFYYVMLNREEAIIDQGNINGIFLGYTIANLSDYLTRE